MESHRRGGLRWAKKFPGDVSVMVKDVLGLALREGESKTNHGPSEDREGGVVRKNVRRNMRFH